MNEELKTIKKKFGEEMMHLCRDLFPTILENKGLLSKILFMRFEPNHELYNDIITNNLINEFKKYIFSFTEIKGDNDLDIDKTPEELFDEVEYILYECHTEEDIQSFKKYYAPRERLCTFDGGRLKRCRVFFAVKKNVYEIKREDYPNPERQDEYGTSVISIQFTKDGTNTLSIKNRYNHTVQNPDATFSNNLDNIIEGLTKSFEKHYDLVQKYKQGKFEIPNYIMANDGKFYKYNLETQGIFYCNNNVIIDHFQVKRFEKEKYLVFETFILDLQQKKIQLYLNKPDTFCDGLKDIKNIRVSNNNEGKIIFITPNNGEIVEIEIDKNSNIIAYKNNNLKEVGLGFLYYNKKLVKLEANNLKTIGGGFLYKNTNLKEIVLPMVTKIGPHFIFNNEIITRVELPNVKEIETYFLNNNKKLLTLSLPKVKSIKQGFLHSNKILEELYLPKLLNTPYMFLYNNEKLSKLECSNLKEIDGYFLDNNVRLQELSLPNVEIILYDFLGKNNKILKLYLPKVVSVGINFLLNNNSLKVFNAPNLEEIYQGFLNNNHCLEEFFVPSLIKFQSNCLENHPNINLPEIVDGNKMNNARKRGCDG